MRGRVVHVGSEPDRVPDAGAFQERQQIRNLAFAPLRQTVTKRNRVFANHSDRHVGGDYLPGRIGCREFALQPGQLQRSEDAGVDAVAAPVQR